MRQYYERYEPMTIEQQVQLRKEYREIWNYNGHWKGYRENIVSNMLHVQGCPECRVMSVFKGDGTGTCVNCGNREGVIVFCCHENKCEMLRERRKSKGIIVGTSGRAERDKNE